MFSEPVLQVGDSKLLEGKDHVTVSPKPGAQQGLDLTLLLPWTFGFNKKKKVTTGAAM